MIRESESRGKPGWYEVLDEIEALQRTNVAARKEEARRRILVQRCHIALQMPDILDAVFAAFDRNVKEDYIACINAARVCRSFMDPAERVIWNEIPTLSTLWNLLLKDGPMLRLFIQKGQRHFDGREGRHAVAAFRASTVRLFP